MLEFACGVEFSVEIVVSMELRNVFRTMDENISL